jgi:hypothetical protein
MTRIYTSIPSFETIFEQCLNPIWNYEKDDQYTQQEMVFLIN